MGRKTLLSISPSAPLLVRSRSCRSKHSELPWNSLWTDITSLRIRQPMFLPSWLSAVYWRRWTTSTKLWASSLLLCLCFWCLHCSLRLELSILTCERDSVNPLYYVSFTTATLCASFVLFRGFNTTDKVATISLLCGFLVIFSGVYLLNLSRTDPDGRATGRPDDEDAVPTDGIAGIQTRRSLQARRSIDPHRRSSSSIAYFNGPSDREGLMRSYDLESGAAFGLEDLTEEPDDASDNHSPRQTNGTTEHHPDDPIPNANGTKPWDRGSLLPVFLFATLFFLFLSSMGSWYIYFYLHTSQHWIDALQMTTSGATLFPRLTGIIIRKKLKKKKKKKKNQHETDHENNQQDRR